MERASLSVCVKRRPLSELSPYDVGHLLCQLGLDKHVANFERLNVDGIMLMALKTEKDLEGELGMSSHVQRVNLIAHVKEFVDKKGVPVELLEPVRGVERARALSSLNVDEVGRLLETIELPSIVEKASEHRVDGSLLAEVTDDDLKKELNVESRLQRSKLLKKVKEFKTYGVPGQLVSDPAERQYEEDIPPPPDEAPPLMSRDSLDAGPANEAKFGEVEEEKYSHK